MHRSTLKLFSEETFFQMMGWQILDLFSLGGLLSYFRPRDDTLENSCCQIFK